MTRGACSAQGNGFSRSISADQWSEVRKVVTRARAELQRSIPLTRKPVVSYEFLIELAMAADALDPGAFQCLAYAYKNGKGVARDPGETVRWLERSAAAGQRAGMTDLGGYYWRGEGVPQNKGKAVELWRKAAAGATSPPRRSCAS